MTAHYDATSTSPSQARPLPRAAFAAVCALVLLAPLACGKYGKPVRSTGYRTAAPEFVTALAPMRAPDPGSKPVSKPIVKR